MTKTNSLPLPNSNPLQEKFINYLMKDGKKTIARKIFRTTLDLIRKKGVKDPVLIFEKAIENVSPSLEVKPKRIGGAVYQIPTEVKSIRQKTLAFRWILTAARTKKGKPIASKLAEELVDASNSTGNAFKKKEDTHKMAAANKAFAHFARY